MKSLTLTPKPLVQRPSFKDIYPGQYWILEKKATKERSLVYCLSIDDNKVRWFLRSGINSLTSYNEEYYDVIHEVNLYGVT